MDIKRIIEIGGEDKADTLGMILSKNIDIVVDNEGCISADVFDNLIKDLIEWNESEVNKSIFNLVSGQAIKNVVNEFNISTSNPLTFIDKLEKLSEQDINTLKVFRGVMTHKEFREYYLNKFNKREGGIDS